MQMLRYTETSKQINLLQEKIKKRVLQRENLFNISLILFLLSTFAEKEAVHDTENKISNN